LISAQINHGKNCIALEVVACLGLVVGDYIGGSTKLCYGMGNLFVMYSHTTSMLYFNCVDIGTTGAPLAMVPWINF